MNGKDDINLERPQCKLQISRELKKRLHADIKTIFLQGNPKSNKSVLIDSVLQS